MKKVLFLIINNETLILLDRLKYDAEIYDKIFVFEANKTFSGERKELFVEKYLQLFIDVTPKFSYVPIYDLPDPDRDVVLLGSNNQTITENRWIVEHAMRNTAMKIFKDIENEYGSDVLLTFCDVDEIVSKDDLINLNLDRNQVHIHFFHEFRMSISTAGYKKNGPIRGGYSALLKLFKENDVNVNNLRSATANSLGVVSSWNIATSFCLRNLDGSSYYPKIEYPDLKQTHNLNQLLLGWHLTTMHGGIPNLIGHKVENFSHVEYSSGNKVESLDIIKLMWDGQIKKDPVDFSQVISCAPHFLLKNSVAPNFYLPGP